MNLNDLTIGQARELVNLFNAQPSATAGYNIASPMIGKYVIARCYSAGVHAGTVEAVDGENVVLRDSRRLWSWKANDGVALSGVAQYGLKKGSSKVDVVNPSIYLTGVCELIPVADGIKDSIHGY
jgi:hypothetical protein